MEQRIESDVVLLGTTNYTGNTAAKIQRAPFSVGSATTDGVVVAAVPLASIRVLALHINCGATATAATFNSKPAGGGAAIFGQFQMGANGGAVLPHNDHGWMQSNAGEGLSLTTSAGSTVTGTVLYVLV